MPRLPQQVESKPHSSPQGTHLRIDTCLILGPADHPREEGACICSLVLKLFPFSEPPREHGDLVACSQPLPLSTVYAAPLIFPTVPFTVEESLVMLGIYSL